MHVRMLLDCWPSHPQQLSCQGLKCARQKFPEDYFRSGVRVVAVQELWTSGQRPIHCEWEHWAYHLCWQDTCTHEL